MKTRKETVLRARCDRRLKVDLQTVAALQSLDTSDIIRIACSHYVENFKNQGLSGLVGNPQTIRSKT
jgi:hypothetical protein